MHPVEKTAVWFLIQTQAPALPTVSRLTHKEDTQRSGTRLLLRLSPFTPMTMRLGIFNKIMQQNLICFPLSLL